MRLLNPFRRFLNQFSELLAPPASVKTLVQLVLGLLVGWWLYVPLHELLHAGACLSAGGSVTRLEIQPLYGGRLLSALFSFVTPGGNYAGRLTGFDTHGSDWGYTLTILGPYILTLLAEPGLRAAARARRPVLFGALVPAFWAPLMSLGGDFFELGSLLLFQLWPGPGAVHRALVSDDVFRLWGEIGPNSVNPVPGDAHLFVYIALAFSAACLWLVLVAAGICGDVWEGRRSKSNRNASLTALQ